jgi:hypothetical protein
MAYRMRGRFLEACDCSVPCPCWFDEEPDEDACTGLIAWQIEQGEIDGVDVSGLSAVSVSQHGGRREHSHKMAVALFLDESAEEAQHDAMKKAFSGAIGGPLGELAEMTSELLAVEPAAITIATDGATTRLNVGPAITTESTVLTGATDRVITIGDGVMSTLLGTPGEVGKTRVFSLRLSAHDIELDLSDRSATSGRFSYAHAG